MVLSFHPEWERRAIFLIVPREQHVEGAEQRGGGGSVSGDHTWLLHTSAGDMETENTEREDLLWTCSSLLSLYLFIKFFAYRYSIEIITNQPNHNKNQSKSTKPKPKSVRWGLQRLHNFFHIKNSFDGTSESQFIIISSRDRSGRTFGKNWNQRENWLIPCSAGDPRTLLEDPSGGSRPDFKNHCISHIWTFP